MKGKKVLVTGAGTGIGREIALEFARRGADVVAHYAHSGEGAESAVQEMATLGVKAKAIGADLSDITKAIQLVNDSVEFLGGLDVLVNNAGITLTLEFEKVTPQQYDKVYDVNVKAQFFIIQAALSHLRKSEGSILNLSSVHGLRGSKGHAVYAGTKGAIIAHTRELAIELAAKKIRVNAIAPGLIPVQNHYKASGEECFEGFDKFIPAGFVGTPLDIAKAAVFLSSEEARYIVGQTIVIDGGTTSWMSFSNGFEEIGLRLGKGYVPDL
ncbi:SDR family NAD(P)-dependent oxidoreductase [Parapedobacter sp. 2B3]|uniref:SDR family NAD(P)-dependent oxidoreductase n=1 Tax=Parapedobacter sp. 2B3 TaxID=3342381 RepID=UPI0035B5F020